MCVCERERERESVCVRERERADDDDDEEKIARCYSHMLRYFDLSLAAGMPYSSSLDVSASL